MVVCMQVVILYHNLYQDMHPKWLLAIHPHGRLHLKHQLNYPLNLDHLLLAQLRTNNQKSPHFFMGCT